MWTQTYKPLGNLFLSALVAALPVVVLLGLLAFTKVKAYFAALAGLAASLIVALVVYRMPANLAAMSALFGIANGLFPIGWIVVGAIFVYDITVQTGQFEVLKHSVAGMADDRRIQVLLIAFSFGAFLEGAAGFGTPVAISAAMLIGLGFQPLTAAGLSLIGNTAPVAFGALGTPTIVLSQVTGMPVEALSAMVGRQVPFFSLIIPFWLIWTMSGWRKMLEVWPACLTAGLSFGIMQFAVSNFHGPWLVDIAASVVSIGSLLVLLEFWQPKMIWRFAHEEDEPASGGQPVAGHGDLGAGVAGGGGPAAAAAAKSNAPAKYPTPTRRAEIVAWMPWVIVSVLVFIWGVPQVKTHLNGTKKHTGDSHTSLYTEIDVNVPYLNGHVMRAPPVVLPGAKPEAAVFTFTWLSATGTGLVLAGIISGLLLGVNPVRLAIIFAGTLYRVRWFLLTIGAMMGIGYSTRYAGLDATMGLAFASTGALFPFFSPLLGWLGVALTGSDASSNVLFGSLQQVTARQLGIAPVLAAAANSSGGVMGKMIDAPSILVAGVATGQQGNEGKILRYVFFHSVALAVLVGLLVLLQAHALRSWIPVIPPK
jgi:lactate permease